VHPSEHQNFTKPETEEERVERGITDVSDMEDCPKTVQELINLLEKTQKSTQADEYFKKIFQ